MCTRTDHISEDLFGPDSLGLRHRYTRILLEERFHESIRKIVSDFFGSKTFEAFTPIQIRAALLLGNPIPHTGSFSDLVLCAPTGDGKTLAYVLPLLSNFLTHYRYIDNVELACQVLIFVPTRELAQQVTNVVRQCTHLLLREKAFKKKKSSNKQLEDVATPFVSNLVEASFLPFNRRTYIHGHDLSSVLTSVFVISTPAKFLDCMRRYDTPDVERTSQSRHCSHSRGRANGDLLRSLLYVIYDEADKFLEDEYLAEWIEHIHLELAQTTNKPRKILVSATGQIQDAVKLKNFKLSNALFILRNPISSPSINLGVDAVFQIPSTLVQFKAKVASELSNDVSVTSHTMRAFALCLLIEQLLTKWIQGNGFDEFVQFCSTRSNPNSQQSANKENGSDHVEREANFNSSDSDSVPKTRRSPLCLNERFSSRYPKIMIFCDTRSKAQYVYECLIVHFGSSNSDLDQTKRSRTWPHLQFAAFTSELAKAQRPVVLDRFVKGETHILISTYVLSRGLDIPDVDMVIIFGAPRHHVTYLHCIGRTARAGRSGFSVFLYNSNEQTRIKEELTLKKNIQIGSSTLSCIMDLVQPYPDLNKAAILQWAQRNRETVAKIVALPAPSAKDKMKPDLSQ